MRKQCKNVIPYMYLLPLHEQLADINKIIEYCSNVKYLYENAKKRFNYIKQLKEVKWSIIIEDIAQLR